MTLNMVLVLYPNCLVLRGFQRVGCWFVAECELSFNKVAKEQFVGFEFVILVDSSKYRTFNRTRMNCEWIRFILAGNNNFGGYYFAN